MTKMSWNAALLAAAIAVAASVGPARAQSCHDTEVADEVHDAIERYVAANFRDLVEIERPEYCFLFEVPDGTEGYEDGTRLAIGVTNPNDQPAGARMVGLAPRGMDPGAGGLLPLSEPEWGKQFSYPKPAAGKSLCRNADNWGSVHVHQFVELQFCRNWRTVGVRNLQVEVVTQGQITETICLPCIGEMINIIDQIGPVNYLQFCGNALRNSKCKFPLGEVP